MSKDQPYYIPSKNGDIIISDEIYNCGLDYREYCLYVHCLELAETDRVSNPLMIAEQFPPLTEQFPLLTEQVVKEGLSELEDLNLIKIEKVSEISYRYVILPFPIEDRRK